MMQAAVRGSTSQDLGGKTDPKKYVPDPPLRPGWISLSRKPRTVCAGLRHGVQDRNRLEAHCLCLQPIQDGSRLGRGGQRGADHCVAVQLCRAGRLLLVDTPHLGSNFTAKAFLSSPWGPMILDQSEGGSA